MAQVIQDEGVGGSMQALANILQLAGEKERMRQERQATEKILAALASGDDDVLQQAVAAAQNFQPEYSQGPVRGMMQRLGNATMNGPSPGVSALSQVGIPMVNMKTRLDESRSQRENLSQRTQADIEASKARQAYYSRGGNDMEDLLMIQAGENNAKTPEQKEVWLKLRTDWLARRQGAAQQTGPGARRIETFDQYTGEQHINGEPTGVIAPDFPGANPPAAKPSGQNSTQQPPARIVTYNGKKYRITGYDKDGTPLGEEMP